MVGYMQSKIITILIIVLMIPSTGVIVWFFVSTLTAFKKFESLDESVQKKLLFMDYYMYLVRRLTIDKLKKISTFSDEEMVSFNSLRDIEKSLKLIKKKLSEK
jgi:uncharacterized membrane protein